MELSNLQKQIIETKKSKVIVLAAAASGKALSYGSKVYTDNGPINIENLLLNTQIYGEDGKLHRVIGIFPQGKKQEYIVTFSDKTQIKCCEDHLWTFQTENLRSKKSKTWITCSLKELIEKYPLYKDARAKNNFGKKPSKRKNIFIPMTEPINFSKKDVEIDPYTMGALLGDGSFKTSCFTNEDKDVLFWVNQGLEQIGCKLIHQKNYDYYINSNQKQIFSKILKQYNLWKLDSSKKFIPPEYKYNSIENRLALLQGLIDTDGYCEGSSYDLILKSQQLILDCKEICESLGLTAILSEKKAICTNSSVGKKDCGIVYRLRIKTSKNFPKLHRSQKREQQWKPTKVYSHRAIIKIVPTNNYVDMTCISINNPTQLFVTDNFIVTHNTRVLTERVKYLLDEGVLPKNIVVFTFTNAAAEEMRKRIGDKGAGCFINTVHSYAFSLLMKNGIDTSSAINEEDFDEFFRLIKNNPQVIEPVEYLLLDEAQDSNSLQYEFILNMIKPKNSFFVGDYRQSIYTFNDGRPDILLDLSFDPHYTTYDLNENYRNGPHILNFAKKLISGSLLGDYELYDDSICMNDLDIDYVTEVEYLPSQVIKFIKNKPDYGNWFILTRTNAQLDTVVNYLTKAEIPCDTFKRSQITSEEFQEKMNANTVKVLTVHAAKGLEADNVIVIGVSKWNKKAEERRIAYVAATRARHRLIWMRGKDRPRTSSWE